MYYQHPLLTQWQAFNPQAPYVFEGDLDRIPDKSIAILNSFEAYARSVEFGEPNNIKLHLGLLPMPFGGSLPHAKIFILMLNPGLGATDYFGEYQVPGFRETLLRTIWQQNHSDEYPFMFLDPDLAWHGGFNYWEGKFRNIALHLKKTRGITYQESLSYISKAIACLELIPYHSKSFGQHALLKSLESTQLMLDYVHTVLEPRAQQGDSLIVVTRQVKEWGLFEHRNIVIYEGGETRGAHLTVNSRGGRAIAEILGA